MRILVHLGLNKCASTYIQQALAQAQAPLRRAGVFYAVEGGRAAQYGLSRHYGFGPEVGGLTPRSLGWLAAEAARRGCARMIVSSEYLSLHRPAAIAAFLADLAELGAEARFLLFSRDAEPWIRSLFNQYVKTVDTGPHFRSINGFADHVLGNGAVDIARRHRAWAEAAGARRLDHYRIAPDQRPEDVLAPFADFAGLPIPPADAAGAAAGNRSLAPGALFLTGLLRQAAPSPARDSLLQLIAGRECGWVAVPEDYLALDEERRARIAAEVTGPRDGLPLRALPANGHGARGSPHGLASASGRPIAAGEAA